MKIRIFLSVVISVFFIFLSFVFAKLSLAAPRLYFDPSSVTVNKNSEFEITLGIDVESQSSFGADATINFSSNDLELKSVSAGAFFPDFTYGQGSGIIEIHGYFSNLYDSKSGSGTLAKIKFLAKKDGGVGTISFTCSGADNDTQILDSNGNNILNCGSLNQTSLTFQGSSGTGGTEATPTPTAAATGTPKPTKKPTAKPTIKPTATPPGSSPSFQPVALSTYEPLSPLPEIPPEGEEGKGFSRFLPFAIGGGIGLVLVILAVFIIKKSKKGNWPPRKPKNIIEGISPPYTPPPNPGTPV